MSKDEIDRMVKEAEQYAEEDRKRREEAEVRNNAESLVHQTEKVIKDNEDKIPAEVKSETESALGELKSALEGSDIDAIRSASEKVALSSQKIGSAIYGQAQEGAASGEGAGESAQGAQSEQDDVVDAEIVDEDDGKRGSGS